MKFVNKIRDCWGGYGHIVPQSFTHGTSEQRKYWFLKGYKTGDIKQGDTFAELR